MDWLIDPHNWIALVTLTTLEIILGIDNIVVISILSGKLPPHPTPLPSPFATARGGTPPSDPARHRPRLHVPLFQAEKGNPETGLLPPRV
jgi:hypothetical protein